MPELPEVEILVRHLAPLLTGARIRRVEVRRPRTVRPHRPEEIAQALEGATIQRVHRRGKFLLFDFLPGPGCPSRTLIGHLGMTGRMFLQPAQTALPKHTAVWLDLGRRRWLFEDARGFGRLTLDSSAVDSLGPEPLGGEFTPERLAKALRHSRRPIKVALLDQSVVAGIGNIYASEILHLAGLSPRRAAGGLKRVEVQRLHAAIRGQLSEAIGRGSSLALAFDGRGAGDGLFYYGRSPDAPEDGAERFLMYDRAGFPCPDCSTQIRRIVQAARSTFFCPRCQR